MFSWWFEARLASCPETKTYTLCPQGLAVPGIQKAEISQLLAHPEITEQKSKLLEKAGELPPLVSTSQTLDKLNQLIKTFPTPDFLAGYPFLKEYL